ncbi:transmembrane protein 79 [Myripristis murdjan]|uniref:Transmembrane protein 79a n=1 Tax=Myripristis murdjan TaxID=586833 RepID=A0A667X4N5_9TELE|nr:transmembrane protein 79-like [Myripristis murdjan]
MSGQSDLIPESEISAAATSGTVAEPQISGGKNQQGLENNGIEEKKQENTEEESAQEEAPGSALLEPSTLPWPGDKEKRLEASGDGASSEKGVSEEDERDRGTSGGSQDLSEDRSQAESDRKQKAKWRESMPEGERWREDEVELERADKGDGSLADDEEEEKREDSPVNWMPEKAARVFTPEVKIVHPSSKELPEESTLYIEKELEKEPLTEPVHYYPEWTEQDDNYTYVCDNGCSEKIKLGLATAAAAVLFPLLVWGGYALLPFDAPLLLDAPLRLVYTLRCSFFAMVPVILGVVVQGVARLRYSALKPLSHGKPESQEVSVHWHYVNESLALFLFHFLQLAVMSTYIEQDLLKLVPLLTIVFVFGRLIYWVCLSLDSSVRALGFGLSFFPILVMLGTNLYFICMSLGEGVVFSVAPPTTPPAPRQRWWF